MTAPNPIDRADELSQEFIDDVMKAAGDSEKDALRLIADAIQASQRHEKRLQDLRLNLAQRMRDAGVPMTEIAEAAKVNDSYLARKLIAAGAVRRNDRRRRRNGRRLPPTGRTV